MSEPKISILLPTRNREKHLLRAVETLYDNAVEPDDLELLLYTDDDQPEATEVLFGNVSKHLNLEGVKEFRTPRLGYDKMYLYYNFLAERASGELLFVWNDDTEMLTPGWDEKLFLNYDYHKPEIQFIRRDTCKTADDSFPVIDRKIFEAVGRLAQHCYVDTWLSHVANEAGVRHFRNDIVFHHHRLQDETAADEKTVITRELHVAFPALASERSIDAQKIKELYVRLGGQL